MTINCREPISYETKELFRYLRGRGITILSTSKGLMTAREAYKQKLGGELLCKVV